MRVLTSASPIEEVKGMLILEPWPVDEFSKWRMLNILRYKFGNDGTLQNYTGHYYADHNVTSAWLVATSTFEVDSEFVLTFAAAIYFGLCETGV